MWKVLVFAAGDGAGSLIVLVLDSGVVGVTEAVASLDPTVLDEG